MQIECIVCGKTFTPSSEYIYKLKKNKKMKYACGYSCYRRAGGDSGKKVTKCKWA